MQIVPKPEVKKRPKFANKLSVVMIMLDSTSNAQFTRMMPQTEKYLKANTKTIIFKGQYARRDKRFLSVLWQSLDVHKFVEDFSLK